MKAIGVIPARLGSTRLAEKVLKPIAGKPMIQHVWEKAHAAKRLDRVIVACDDARIKSCVENFGGEALLTRADHPNGTSRIAEIASREKADLIVNIQGDEPMMHPASIDLLVDAMDQNAAVKMGTLAVRRTDRAEFENPNVVKVILDCRKYAVYFSRSPIPYVREAADWQNFSFLKHLGIYAYRRDFLLEFVKWPTSLLENYEKLEQLRVLEQGFEILVLETPHDSLSVDTFEDLTRVELRIKSACEKNVTGVV